MTMHNAFSHFSFDAPLAPQEAFARFPVLAQEAKHARCSEKYVHISTAQIVERMHAEGFELTAVTTARTRDAARANFTKHMLRWKYTGESLLGDVASFDVIGMNSHDTSRAFVFAAGFTVRACLNGCVFGEAFERIRIHHTANALDKVSDAVARVLHNGPAVAARVDAMRARVLTEAAQEEFATRALAVRYDAGKAPVSPSALLAPKREADNGATLWQAFNKAQEYLIRGGLKGVTVGDNGRPRIRSIRAVRGIDQNVSINSRLLDLALEYA